MNVYRRYPSLRVAAVLAGALGFLSACSSDSPSAPRQQPAPPPGSQPASAVWNITVTANPPELGAGTQDSSTITITVRRADTGQPPPNGTTIAVSTTLGEFGSPGSGIQSGFAQLINGGAQLALFPGEITGTALIQAVLEGSVGQATVVIRGPEAFFLAAVEPNSGSPQGGETVTIRGGGFVAPVRVLFGGVVAQVQSVSPSRIRVTTPRSPQQVPVGSTLAVTVSVTIRLNQEGEATDALPNGFTYAHGGVILQPQIFSVTPASGPNEGGTRVTINGDGFDAPVQVFFGQGTSATNFDGVEATVESVSRTRIVVISPAALSFGQNNQNQVVDILVKNLNTGFFAIAPQAFKYGVKVLITAISPGAGIFSGGTLVTIFGQGFDEPVAVQIGGVGQDVISVSGTEVVIRTVAVRVEDCALDAAGFSNNRGVVQVTNIETGDSAEGPEFEYLIPEPLITGISPSSGFETGGTLVTITGSGFTAPVRVLFGDQAGSVSSVSPTQITVVTPRFTGTFPEVDCDDNGDGTLGKRFVPTSVDVTVINLETGCEDVFEKGFTYNPSDQSCRGDVGETTEPQCSDGVDNDGDTAIDFPDDPECADADDDDESA